MHGRAAEYLLFLVAAGIEVGRSGDGKMLLLEAVGMEGSAPPRGDRDAGWLALM